MVLVVIPIRIYKEIAILQTEFQSNWYKIHSQKTEFRPCFHLSFQRVCPQDKNRRNSNILFRMNLNTEYHSGYYRILFLYKTKKTNSNSIIMVVSHDKVISIIYELRINKADGKIIESLKKDAPLNFVYGAGSLLPRLEANLAGLGTGDNFSFFLNAEDAYGEVDHNALVNVPLGAFEVDGKVDYNLVKTGNKIPMQDASGNRLNGLVKEISTDTVTMDFNHPLAGNSLFFTGQIIDIRESTEEERNHGHAHQAGGCEGCSDCGGQEGSCC